MVLQCALINPPFKIPSDPPHPPSASMIISDRKIHTLIMAKTTAIRTGKASPPLLFRHISPGPGDSTLQFRLLHFWEARKNVKGGPGILLGIEMLMIDAEGTLAQGFIGQNRRNQYEKELQREAGNLHLTRLCPAEG
ncbi:PREDICTED: uncharacterized protein LOC106314295 [Brassica oleracea var. oleracea]|uniref:uncharacterized protein LOC106314295 n=1 Tax=Brassica oleracea var. oleracea TaxID=109376 RepID=UPI0006A6F6F3|nr:PREDICTED: uncharacterized protein LOC106314295 [Brassica oleracea var. oleracea]